MNSELKKKWIKALRSGEYRQGMHLLKRINPKTQEPEGYCCIGVLCELLVQEGKARWVMAGRDDALAIEMTPGMESNIMLTGDIRREIELHETLEDLVEMNDSKRLSFWHIANHIEKHY